MRVKAVIAVTLTALVLSAGSANAFQWHMRFGQAKNASKEYTKDLCADLRECIGWGVGQCYRQSNSRFDCTIGTWFPGKEAGEEIECRQVLHWGASYSGYVVLKNAGRPNCQAVS